MPINPTNTKLCVRASLATRYEQLETTFLAFDRTTEEMLIVVIPMGEEKLEPWRQIIPANKFHPPA